MSELNFFLARYDPLGLYYNIIVPPLKIFVSPSIHYYEIKFFDGGQ